jgi:hypothetical protein
MEKIVAELKKGEMGNDIRWVLLNLLLVQFGARQAFLIETANLDRGLKKARFSEIIKRLHSAGIHAYLDPISVEGLEEKYKPYLGKELIHVGFPALSDEENPRFWVTRSDKKMNIPTTEEEVGILLGMKDPGGDYYHFTKKRTFLSIVEQGTGLEITAEVLKGDKEENKAFAKEKANSFTEAMKQAGLPYRFRAKLEVDDGTVVRAHELAQGNTEYVVEHQKEYLNDLTNILSEHHVVVLVFKRMMREKKLVKKYIPLYLSFYRIFRPEKDLFRVEERINEKVAKEWV